ncbi:hypothetical protein T439DRAFT_321958 [Meredithblackwellia eburnea MCA 4105]
MGSPFKFFHLIHFDDYDLDGDVSKLTAAQLAAAWIGHPDFDGHIHERKIKRAWRAKREQARARGELNNPDVPMGFNAPPELRRLDPFVRFELIDLTFSIPEDLDELNSAQLAVLPFHPEFNSEKHGFRACDLFGKRRDRDIENGLDIPTVATSIALVRVKAETMDTQVIQDQPYPQSSPSFFVTPPPTALMAPTPIQSHDARASSSQTSFTTPSDIASPRLVVSSEKQDHMDVDILRNVESIGEEIDELQDDEPPVLSSRKRKGKSKAKDVTSTKRLKKEKEKEKGRPLPAQNTSQAVSTKSKSSTLNQSKARKEIQSATTPSPPTVRRTASSLNPSPKQAPTSQPDLSSIMSPKPHTLPVMFTSRSPPPPNSDSRKRGRPAKKKVKPWGFGDSVPTTISSLATPRFDRTFSHKKAAEAWNSVLKQFADSYWKAVASGELRPPPDQDGDEDEDEDELADTSDWESLYGWQEPTRADSDTSDDEEEIPLAIALLKAESIADSSSMSRQSSHQSAVGASVPTLPSLSIPDTITGPSSASPSSTTLAAAAGLCSLFANHHNALSVEREQATNSTESLLGDHLLHMPPVSFPPVLDLMPVGTVISPPAVTSCATSVLTPIVPTPNVSATTIPALPALSTELILIENQDMPDTTLPRKVTADADADSSVPPPDGDLSGLYSGLSPDSDDPIAPTLILVQISPSTENNRPTASAFFDEQPASISRASSSADLDTISADEANDALSIPFPSSDADDDEDELLIEDPQQATSEFLAEFDALISVWTEQLELCKNVPEPAQLQEEEEEDVKPILRFPSLQAKPSSPVIHQLPVKPSFSFSDDDEVPPAIVDSWSRIFIHGVPTDASRDEAWTWLVPSTVPPPIALRPMRGKSSAWLAAYPNQKQMSKVIKTLRTFSPPGRPDVSLRLSTNVVTNAANSNWSWLDTSEAYKDSMRPQLPSIPDQSPSSQSTSMVTAPQALELDRRPSGSLPAHLTHSLKTVVINNLPNEVSRLDVVQYFLSEPNLWGVAEPRKQGSRASKRGTNGSVLIACPNINEIHAQLCRAWINKKSFPGSDSTMWHTDKNIHHDWRWEEMTDAFIAQHQDAALEALSRLESPPPAPTPALLRREWGTPSPEPILRGSQKRLRSPSVTANEDQAAKRQWGGAASPDPSLYPLPSPHSEEKKPLRYEFFPMREDIPPPAPATATSAPKSPVPVQLRRESYERPSRLPSQSHVARGHSRTRSPLPDPVHRSPSPVRAPVSNSKWSPVPSRRRSLSPQRGPLPPNPRFEPSQRYQSQRFEPSTSSRSRAPLPPQVSYRPPAQEERRARAPLPPHDDRRPPPQQNSRYGATHSQSHEYYRHSPPPYSSRDPRRGERVEERYEYRPRSRSRSPDPRYGRRAPLPPPPQQYRERSPTRARTMNYEW